MNKQNNMWMISGNNHTQIDANFTITDNLPKGIYNLNIDESGKWFLTKYAEEFIFSYKLYDLENDFIDHFIKTYQCSTGNLGCLFSGIKGTGKSVAAKMIANKLGLPIIIVKSMGQLNQSMIEYLSSINTECVLFFDEFEKNFDSKDSTILQIMDGVYNSDFRKVFLLTTNSLYINENLIGRPSRIRYVKQFGNLSLNAVNEFLDDNLNDLSLKQNVIDFVNTLNISTIDILKSVVSEINIHGWEEFQQYNNVINVEFGKYYYSAIYTSVYKAEKTEDQNINNFYSIVKPASRNKDIKLDTLSSIHFTDGFDDCNCTESKSFNNLTIGDKFDHEQIIQIDYDKHIIVTQTDSYYHFYYILNPNAQTSLYNLTHVF